MVKEVFNMGKVSLNEMQLVYLTDIFEDIYNIVCVPFETDSVNVMKNMKEILITINLASSYQKTMEIVTRNNNTRNVRKPYWFVTNSRET